MTNSTPKKDKTKDLIKRTRDIRKELEAIDKILYSRDNTSTTTSCSGSSQFLTFGPNGSWSAEIPPMTHNSSTIADYFKKLANQSNTPLDPHAASELKEIIKQQVNKKGLHFSLDILDIEEYKVTKSGSKITYTISFDETSIQSDTSYASGMLGLYKIMSKWDYDSMSVTVDKNGFESVIKNIREKIGRASCRERV